MQHKSFGDVGSEPTLASCMLATISAAYATYDKCITTGQRGAKCCYSLHCTHILIVVQCFFLENPMHFRAMCQWSISHEEDL
eukprot:5581062-Ditylum_brightwellii.AAC.1